jgi:hypothetical protein
MYRRDRVTNTALLGLAAAAWAAVAVVLVRYDPVGSPAVLLGGALLLGGAVALTLTPMLWLAGFVLGRRIAYRGDWWRAARRGLLVGLVVTLVVLLLGQDMFSPPIGIFIVVMAALVEMTLSLRRG